MLGLLDRHTRWELIERVPLDFATFHPQGLAFARGLTFLSSVEILEAPRPDEAEPAGWRAGRGVGHLFVIDHEGLLLRNIVCGTGAIYHPGGIDFDGTNIWMPLAEYRPGGQSIICSLDPETFELRERFRVADHIGWVVADAAKALVHGGSWGSRWFYTWTADGVEVSRWENPSHFIDYQDCRYIGDGLIVCGGIAVLSGAAETFELGGLAVIDVDRRAIVHEFPLSLYSKADHVVTRNPVVVAREGAVVTMWVAPDDGFDRGGTELLKYRTSPER